MTLEEALQNARNSLTADRLDMSFGELMNMYQADELVIDPAFQRYFRWDQYQRTRFIESLLLGIPIPSIFVAEDDHGRWEIVDGLQRISTMLSFFGSLKGDSASENNWKMCEGDLIPELNDLRRQDLPLKFQLNLKRSAVRIEVIKWDSNYDMRYELFNRLNTGGAPLTDQEIRNCIFRGTGNELSEELRELSSNPILLKLVRPTERQRSQLYLDELVLRFYALLWDVAPNKNLGEHLTEYMRAASRDHSLYAGNKKRFVKTLKVLDSIDDERVFDGKNHAFSPSKYDGIMIGLAKNLAALRKKPEEVRKRIDALVDDPEFMNATGVASNYKRRVQIRVERASVIFAT